MNETQWFACSDSASMLQFLPESTSVRKLRLLCVACCRRIKDFLVHESCDQAIAVAEQCADGVISLDESYALGRELDLFSIGATTSPVAGELAAQTGISEQVIRAAFQAVGLLNGWLNPRQARSIARHASLTIALHAAPHLENYMYDEQGAFEADAAQFEKEERSAQAALVREIFGNPFTPVAIDPRWQTSSVVGVASTIYDERAFDRMPILSDALMDAGCDKDVIITHCRQRQEHVRGCWALDAILAKK